MKKAIILILVLSAIALIGYACDGGSGGNGCDGGGGGGNGICTENITGVSSTAAAKLYYPCNISAPTGATSMSSGWTGGLEDIEWMSEDVAQAGFVVLAFTPSNRWGMVSLWRDAHKACISKLKDLNSTHSVLRGKIDTGKLSTCGHSKGGGGSLWASSQLGSQLRTTIGMAPYEEGFADSALRSITAATFIEAGGSDSLATNAMTRGEYSGLSTSISRKYVEYTGYSHMAWANATGAQASRLSGDAIAWMKYYMNGDASQKSIIADQSGTARFEWVDKGN